jgi:hypothetical protein
MYWLDYRVAGGHGDPDSSHAQLLGLNRPTHLECVGPGGKDLAIARVEDRQGTCLLCSQVVVVYFSAFLIWSIKRVGSVASARPSVSLLS